MAMSCLFPLPFKTQGCQVGRNDPKGQVRHCHIANWLFNPHVLLVYETYSIPHKINKNNYAKIIKDKSQHKQKEFSHHASCWATSMAIISKKFNENLNKNRR